MTNPMRFMAAILIGFAAGGGSVFAADHFGELGGCGGRATNGSCAMDLCIGGMAGAATAPGVSLQAGYLGQIYDATNFHLAAPARSVDSANSILLGGALELDDGTLLAVPGSEIAWSAAGHLWLSIAANGSALAAAVDHDVATAVTGFYHGVSYTMPVYVLDTTPGHFDIVSMTNRTTNLSLYVPSSAIRTYTLESTPDLKTSAWTAVSGQTGRPGDGSLLALSDTNQVRKLLYRVRISPP